jgi:hypothetical protein
MRHPRRALNRIAKGTLRQRGNTNQRERTKVKYAPAVKTIPWAKWKKRTILKIKANPAAITT